MASIERLLELSGRDVTEVAVEALGVVPVHPSEGREVEVLDRPPRSGTGGPRTSSVLWQPFTVSARALLILQIAA